MVSAARHAGIEEAVRRQRAVLVFTLAGDENARIVRHAFQKRLFLHSALQGAGRSLATYGQLRTWSGQYGLDLPDTILDLDRSSNADSIALALTAARDANTAPVPPLPGAWEDAGHTLWVSSRTNSRLVDLVPVMAPCEVAPLPVWDAMARIADRSEIPTPAATASELLRTRQHTNASTGTASIQAHWQAWADTYPTAFPD
jgi:hypothetical protein